MNIINCLNKLIIEIDENVKSASAPVTLNGPQAMALERRIRQELEEQGILAADETSVAQVNLFISSYNLMFLTVSLTDIIK